MELHLISTGRQTKEKLCSVLKRVHFYTDYIHLREKSFGFLDYLEVIEKLTLVGIPLDKIIINDKADVASSLMVGGVQLGSKSESLEKVVQASPELKIGCSVHGVNEAVQKEKEGADYLIYGHVFPTASKPDLPPKGLLELKNTVDNVSIPVIAIGGMKPSNLKQVKECGVGGIAVLSGILLAEDPLAAAIKYAHKIMEVS